MTQSFESLSEFHGAVLGPGWMQLRHRTRVGATWQVYGCQVVASEAVAGASLRRFWVRGNGCAVRRPRRPPSPPRPGPRGGWP